MFLQNDAHIDKIEPAKTSLMENTTSSKILDQNGDFITKESCKSVSVSQRFQIDDK